jgi:two-component system, NtrC family, response regulator HydG
MTDHIALLASSNFSLLESVERLVRETESLRLQTVGTAEDIWGRVSLPEVALVILHVPAEVDDGGVAELARKVAASSRLCRIVVLADVYQSVHAVAFQQAGAADYLGGPFDFAKLEAHLRGSEFAELMEQVRRTAPQDTTLLFTGETGTGKTRLARLVHELSPRRTEPFQVMDCGALSASLIESEMFGHVKGAFTGADRDRPGKLAAVGRGTLLLDEVNALPLPLQSKLLRAVDDRTFEPVGSNKTQKLLARLIAVSNTPLDHDVEAGRFRADLYYRLNVVSFYLPPLRERRGMIAPLALKFLGEFASRNRPDIRGAAPETLRLLEEYDWPGNIRELRNIVERAVALSPGPEIQVRDLPEAIRGGKPTSPRMLPVRAPEPVLSFTLNQSRERAEIQRILEALRKHHNNRLRAAAELGISRMGLYKKLRKYGLMNASASA